MSKKKTNKKAVVKRSAPIGLIALISVIVIAAVLIVLAVCGVFTKKPVEPVNDDIYTRIETYLQNKYHVNFLVGEMEGDYAYPCYPPKGSGGEVVQVKPLTAVQSQLGEFAKYFTDEFVDDGYDIYAAKQIETYFQGMLTDAFGTTRIMAYIGTPMPSDINIDSPFENVIMKYSKLLDRQIELYVLTDQNITKDDFDAVAAKLKTLNIGIRFYTSLIPANEQSDCTIFDIAYGWGREDRDSSLFMEYINAPDYEEPIE